MTQFSRKILPFLLPQFSEWEGNFTQYLFRQLSKTIDDSSVLFHSPNHVTSFGELKNLTSNYTNFLSNRVAQNSTALVCFPDSEHSIAITLALLNLGVLPALISSSLSLQHATPYLASLKPDLLVLDTSLPYANHFSESSRQKIIRVNTSSFEAKKHQLPISDKHFLRLSKTLMDPHYIQFTSGSTGNPKPVVHSAQGILYNMDVFSKKTLGISAHDRIFCISSLSFGYGFGSSFFTPLTTGAKAYLLPSKPSIEKIREVFTEFKPTLFFAVPVVYAKLMTLPTLNVVTQSVRLFFSAGAPLSSQQFRQWYENTNKIVLDGIGATEAGHVFITNSPDTYKPGATGKLLEGYEGKIITPEGRLAKTSETGTLWIKGPSTFMGYKGLQKQTSDVLNKGWLNTRDLFTQDEDGFFYYQGRDSHSFKLANGRWINPNTLETYIKNRFNFIQEAALVLRTFEEKPLKILYLSVPISKKLSKKDLIYYINEQILEGNLLKEIVPDRIVIQTDDFLRNPNGKVLRALLGTKRAKL